ncbi:MAG: RluA family pseudouridine synthase [Ferrovum sp.]|nr:RluA family pseudouridine synthase [Ferrovum sp.]
MGSLRKTSVIWEEIDEDADHQRIDNFLLNRLKGVPKSHIYRILRSGEVRVNSGRVDATYRLKIGDRVRIPPVEVPTAKAVPINAPKWGAAPLARAILYEDDGLLALNKPSGVAVHGGSGISLGVIEQLRAERPKTRFLELAHRLDRETSGILLIAKKRSMLVALHDMMRSGAMDKRYYALARGQFKDEKKVVKESLHKFLTESGERRVMVRDDGKISQTIFRRKQRFEEATLLEAQLMTGRTHQIRVHLAHLGCPIAGDDKYGDFAWNKVLARQGLKRMFLHAVSLRFIHPAQEAPLTLEAALPPELNQFLERLTPLTHAL